MNRIKQTEHTHHRETVLGPRKWSASGASGPPNKPAAKLWRIVRVQRKRREINGESPTNYALTNDLKLKMHASEAPCWNVAKLDIIGAEKVHAIFSYMYERCVHVGWTAQLASQYERKTTHTVHLTMAVGCGSGARYLCGSRCLPSAPSGASADTTVDSLIGIIESYRCRNCRRRNDGEHCRRQSSSVSHVRSDIHCR